MLWCDIIQNIVFDNTHISRSLKLMSCTLFCTITNAVYEHHGTCNKTNGKRRVLYLSSSVCLFG